MTYKLTGRPILKGEKNVTIVTIEKEEPGRYSYERVELPGNRTQDNEEVLIQAALDHIRTELDPTSAIVKNQEQLAKTTEALERANQLMEDMQKVNLQNAQDIEDILARLEELEAQGEPDQGEKEEAEEDAPQVTDTENQAEEAEPAPAQPTTEQPVAEAPTQPTPAVEDNKESEKEDDISETTNQESPSEDNGGSNDE
ncbi:hypothetical protein [Streptococcus mitis]|uniref:hypothetical protein n=1 Tax=Streptococcus mitis TaxID=28037 RepID=UPI001C4E42D4|nr:hypothetical protein MissF_0008 [Streptococcus phage MissF]